MNREQFFDCLDFDDDAILDKEVDPVSGLDGDASINDGEAHLAFEPQCIGGKLIVQACTICTLKQARPKRTMNVHGSLDYAFGDVIVNH
jgi:hypothetical protein